MTDKNRKPNLTPADDAEVSVKANVRPEHGPPRRSGPGDLSHQIFATRTLGLAGRLPPEALADYLSGLLIGHELVSGLASVGNLDSRPLVMIGAPQLCERYASSLKFMGYSADAVIDNTAPAGLWNFARAAGLI